MNINSFLYRRLAHWITCEFKLGNGHKISLQDKYEVASFQDVFCHPFYWQAFHWLEQPPQLVVDCGAHCGHFSILLDICIKSKFSDSDTQYILVEPNPHLIPVIQKNLKDAGLSERSLVKQGLLGPKSGQDTLWINYKNFLQTSLSQQLNSKPYDLPYLNLIKLTKNKTIDLMKLDIEGGEFSFIRSNQDIFSRTKLLFMELHEASEKLHQELFMQLKSSGMNPVSKPILSHNQELIIFLNETEL